MVYIFPHVSRDNTVDGLRCLRASHEVNVYVTVTVTGTVNGNGFFDLRRIEDSSILRRITEFFRGIRDAVLGGITEFASLKSFIMMKIFFHLPILN